MDFINVFDNFKPFEFLSLKNLNSKTLAKALEFKAFQIYQINKVGKSFLGKDIYLLKFGNGKKRILLWSQMHGNEPFSTLALMDFLFFISENQDFARQIANKITIFAVPMLNPDGADMFKRRNAQDIDINRDALRLQSPEGRLLMKLAQTLKPNFAFNLHDQEIYYGTQNSQLPTILAFLSPSFDFEQHINKSRLDAMKVISFIIRNLQPFTQNNLAKYNDKFYPTAFGDNLQKNNISTILIEGGFYPKNTEFVVRKFYFSAIYLAISSIAFELFETEDISLYEKLPMNIKNLFVDVILKNLTIVRNQKKYIVDIALWRGSFDPESFSYQKDFFIKDIGDLKFFKSFEVFDCQNKTFVDNDFLIQRNKKANFLLNFAMENCK